MAIFYFHLRDGVDLILDEEGRDCEDFAAIAQSALLDARSILAGDVFDGHIQLDQRIDVEDAAGMVVHRLLFTDAVTIRYPQTT